MADLSNLKIANTFSRLLQADPDTTQLQDGLGDNPPTITFNGTTIKYVDGNQQNNYVLTSDANGVASWAAAGGSDTNVYWSANTNGSISTSGYTTDVRVSGDVYTTDLVLNGGKIRPLSGGGEVIFANADHGSADWLSLSQDLFDFKINGGTNFSISPTEVTFNALNTNQDFQIKTGGGMWSVHTNAQYELLAIGNSGGTSIGGTIARWPTVNGQATSVPLKTLQVNGITTIYSGGNGNLWSADTTALSVVGDISGETNMSLGRNLVVTGNTVMNGTLSATTSCKIGNGDGLVSAATINAITINGTTVEGTIDGGTF